MNFDQIFKAYDIRGVYPDEIDEKKVKRITMAYARFLLKDSNQPPVPSSQSLRIAVGRDVRLSGPKLQKAVIDGLTEAGVNVEDIGPVPTEMLYFAVGFYHFDGGIQVSASHNPAEFNGLKLVRSGVEAISSDSGLKEIQALAESDDNLASLTEGTVETRDVEEDYFDYLTKFVHFDSAPALKIVANNNFGLSGPLAQRFLERLNSNHINLIELNFQPDGTFPKGRPDPSRPENRQETSELIIETKADFGVAWDADGDRFFVVDEKGKAIESCYLSALLTNHILQENPGQKIAYDQRTAWVNTKVITTAGGTPVLSRVGHAFYKSTMRENDAVFGGELSGHFFFRDFYFADNGLIPFLLFLNIVAKTKESVSEMVRLMEEKYIISGEINFEVSDKDKMLAKIEQQYADGSIDRTEGLSITFESWRFNLRASNTENLLRLNVEAKDKSTCDQKTAELTELVNSTNSKK
ncbi:MAG: phosphomannomutase/phosphoglucomutase [Patescibacteria group bacterium]